MAIIGTAYVQIKAITTGLEKDVTSAVNKGLKNVKVDLGKQLNINAPDTSGVRKSFTDIERQSEISSRKASNSFIKNFGNGQISYLIRRIFYMIVWGTPIVGALIGALAQLGGAFLSLASAIAPALSSLAVVPGLLAAAGTGALSLVAAFSGISKAYSAGTKKMAGGGGKAAGAATNNAKQIRDAQQAVARATEDAVDRVARAERDLSDAYESAAEDVLNAQRTVMSSQRDLTDALNESRDAQLGVNRARAEALDDLIELGFAARQAAISEGEAAITLERAREKLAEVSELPINHRLRREAQLNYDQAQLSLEEAVKNNQDTAKASAEAAEKGVEGSDKVVSARNDEAEAAQKVLDVQQELADAERDLAKTRIKSARDVQDAQKNLQDTIRDTNRDILDAQERLQDAMAKTGAAAGGAAGGVDLFARAMENLSPEAQAFVRYMLSIRDVFKKVRDEAGKELFPKLTASLQAIIGSGFFDLIGSGLRIAGSAIGDVALKFADLFTSPFFTGNLATIFSSNVVIIQNLGSALVNLVDLFIAIAAAAAPFTEALTAWVNVKIGAWAESARTNFSGLQDNIATGVDTFLRIWRILVTVKDAIKNLADAAKPAGDVLINAFAGAATHFKEFTDANPARLKAFFDQSAQSVMALGGLLKDVVNLMFRLGEGEPGKGIENIINILRDEAIPAIDELFTKLATSGTGENIAHLFADLIVVLGELLSSGALDAFIDVIQGAVSVLSIFIKLPLVPTLIGWAGAAIGAYKAFNILAEVTGARKIATGIAGATRAMKGFNDTMRVHQALAGMSGQKVSKLSVVFSALGSKFPKIAKAIGLVGNAIKLAFVGNPVGLIIVGIVALVAAFIYLWKNVEGFRNFFKNAWEVIQEAVQFVFEWVKKNWPLLLGILLGPIGLAVAAIIKHWDAIMNGVKAVIDWIKNNWQLLLAILTGPIGLAVLAIKTHWQAIKDGAKGVLDWLKTAWAIISTILMAPFNLVGSLIKAAWTAISNGAKSVIDWVRANWSALQGMIMNPIINAVNAVSGYWNNIKSQAASAVQYVKDVFNSLPGFIGGMAGRIAANAAGMWNGIYSAFKGVYNNIVSAWNNMSFSIGGGSVLGVKIPQVRLDTPNLPYLAKGGTVMAQPGGVAVRVAEAGQNERIEPLDSDGLSAGDRAIINALGSVPTGTAAGGDTYNITIVAQPDMDIQTLARLVSREISFLGA